MTVPRTTALRQAHARSKILIVEDEAIVAMDLESQLGDLGYDICGCFDNARDAIACAHATQPDLVLMDIVIRGGMDGIEAAKHISLTLGIPVVFLTAYSDDTTVRRAAETAPYGYLTKPFQERELRAGIEVAIFKSKLERKLRNSERWFASTLRCVGDGVIATDENACISFMNPVAESILGWSIDEVKGRKMTEIVRLENRHDHQPIPLPMHEAVGHDKVIGIGFGTLLIARDGTRRPIDDSVAPIRDEHGRVLGAVMVFSDARERIAAEDRLRQSEEKFRNVFDFAPVGMALVSMEFRFLQVNAAICQLLGYSGKELLDMGIEDFSSPEEDEQERAMLLDLTTGRSVSGQIERRYRTKSGNDIWVNVTASILRPNQQPVCYLYQVHDISARKTAESRLARMANYDSLTGLANRAMLNEEIERMIATARRYGHQLAVIFLDLDYFKEVNDSLGHEAGDELLKEISARLRASVRESDIVGRLGGDEFVVLLPEIKQAEDIVSVTDKIQAECLKPLRIAGHEVHVGLSLGASIFPEDADNARTLLRYADSALYHAKSEGRGHLQFYRSELTRRVEERMRIGAGLRQALDRRELELYYQPIVAMSDQQTQAAEALVRWNHPELGMLAPDSFIPVAEEIGISASIGAWVIHEACRQAVAWTESGARPIRVAVNVSPSQFKAGNLVQVIKQALTDTRLPPDRLCIEITEKLFLNDTERNRAVIRELKDIGVHVAIDDFGIGYSSLSYISHFGPTELKIDRSLIEHLGDNREYAAVVIAAISMARSLNLDVVTEGVETEEQHAFLKQQGCGMAQGFLYGVPCKAGEFHSWLMAESRAAPSMPS